MLDLIASLLSVSAISLAAYGLGRPLIRGLSLGKLDGLATAAWTLMIGLVTAGLILTGLGLLGLLYRPLIGTLTLAAAFWGLSETAQALSQWIDARESIVPRAPREDDEPHALGPPRWVVEGMLALAAIACCGAFVGALAPPTAGDALCYHLELPKRFLIEHRLTYFPYDENVTYPLLVEVWYLWTLVFDSGVAAQLVHWELGILLGLGTFLLARPVVGKGWAACAAALVLIVPGISNEMTAPLNDVGLAAFTTFALAAWRRATIDEGNPRWFLVAGLMFGGALATKYVACLFVGAVGVSAVVACWNDAGRRRTVLAGGLSVVVVAASVSGVWYVRSAWHRGNPVYPFFASHEGGSVTNPLRSEKRPLGWRPEQLLTAPWQVTMHPERFGGRGHQLGGMFLVSLPGLWIARRLRGLSSLALVACVYVVLWYALRQNVRFLFPIVPLLAVSTVWAWSELRGLPRLPRRVCIVAIGCTVVFAAILPLVRARDKLAVAVGLESRERFLARAEPSYPAASLANDLLTSDAHILSQDIRAFYFDCQVTRESVYRQATGFDQEVDNPRALIQELETRGFTHVLLCEPEGSRQTAPWGRMLDTLLEAHDSRAIALCDYVGRDAEGRGQRYRLVMLR